MSSEPSNSSAAHGVERCVVDPSQATKNRGVTPRTEHCKPPTRDSRGTEKSTGWLRSEVAIALITAIAIALRLIQYLAKTSMSFDEAALALNAIHRSYSTILDQLDFNQGAPPLFLLLQHATQAALGKGEYSFRAVPLVAGVLSPILMIPFARRLLLDARASMLALALFAFSESLILYSATGKQYELDVLAAVAVYLVALNVIELTSFRWTTIWAIVGAISIWISFAAVFVIAGLGLGLIVRDAVLHRWRSVALHSFAAATWLSSFAAVYFVSVVDLSHLEKSLQSESAGGSPASSVPRTVAGAIRSDLGIGRLDLIGQDVGRVVASLAIVLIVVGLAAFVRDRRPTMAALLAAPFLVTLLASELGRYPLFPRTLLFLTPALVASIAYGAVSLVRFSGYVRIVGIVATGVVFVFVAMPTLKHVADPQQGSGLKPALQFLAEHQRKGDTLWVYSASQYGLRYYLECNCFGNRRQVRRGSVLWPLKPARGGPDQFARTLNSAPPRFLVSSSIGDSAAYKSELAALRGQGRVWLLVSDASTDFRSAIFSFADRIGVRQRLPRHPAALSLYDLSRRD